MNIGKNIQKYRKEKGLTQKELASLCGIAQGTIQQYELGKREPRFDTLELIAAKLDVFIIDLLDIDELSPTQQFETLSDYKENDQDLNFLKTLYYSLNKKGKSKAIEQVEMLTKIPEYIEFDTKEE